MPIEKTGSRAIAALSFAAALAFPLTTAQGDDLPSLIDERDPTRAQGLREAIDIPRHEPGAEVSLPDAEEGVNRATPVDVTHIRFVGGTVFPLEELAADFQPMIGTTVALGEIVDAANRITLRYQQAGFPLSYAYLPEQTFADGTIVVAVVEGHIVRTEIEIENEAVKSRVDALARRLFDEVPVSQSTFERQTLLMERIPGAQFAMRAPVPRTANGATTLRVEEREIERFSTGGSLQGGTEDDFLLLVNGSARGFTPYAEQLSIATLLPISDDRYYAADYAQDIGTDGLRISFGANRFEGENDNTVLLLGQNIRVQEDKTRDRFSAALAYPLILTRKETLSLSGRIEHHDEDASYIYSVPGGASVRAKQELRYSALEMSGSYRRLSSERVLELRGEIRQGVDLGNNRNRVTTAGNTVNAPERTEFTRLGAQGRWAEQLAPRWRITARAGGFWSPDRLPRPERGNYGGNRFGRAYPDGQAEGDYGFAGDLEVRYIQPFEGRWLTSIEPYVLIDTARTRFHDVDVKHDLASAVAGFDISNGKNYRIGLEYAYPLSDRDFETDSRDGRINVRLSWNFNS